MNYYWMIEDGFRQYMPVEISDINTVYQLNDVNPLSRGHWERRGYRFVPINEKPEFKVTKESRTKELKKMSFEQIQILATSLDINHYGLLISKILEKEGFV